MLKKERRINSSLFKQVGKGIKAKNFHLPSFSLKVAKIFNKYPSRFAVVVSQKVSKKAVERNLLRRRVFSVLRDFIPDIKGGFSVIIYLKKEAKALNFFELKEELAKALKETDLLENRKNLKKLSK